VKKKIETSILIFIKERLKTATWRS